MAGVELATAYISLVADTKQIPKQVGAALGQVQAQADKAGESIGSRLSAGFGKTLKAGVLTAGAAAGTVAGLAFAKGMGRLTAIDDAQGKLKGLGHDAQSVEKIMDSALASVKGTAYGLGDAATIAASAVAAGIKPGQELTRYLSLTADAAAIAGGELNDVGRVMNNVTTVGSAFNDSLLVLAEKGLPVYAWLSEEMKVSAAEVKKLASEGKVSSEVFLKAIEKNIGGAALEAGKTVSGAIKNVNAALGRLGAKALEPTFARLGGGFGGLTGAIDKITPKVGELSKALDQKVFDEGLPRLHEAFLKFRETDFATSTMSKSVTIMDQLRSTAVATAPALKDVGRSLAEASAVTGGAGLTLGLQTVTGLTTAVSGPLTAALNGASSVMKDHQGVVTGLLMAYAGVKAIKWASQTNALQGLQSAVIGTSGSLKTATGTMAAMRTVSASTGQEMTRLQSAIGYMSTGQGSIARIAGSFRDGQAKAEKFGRTMGTVSAAGTGLKVAAGGVSSMLGGPLGMALGGATVAMAVYGANVAKAAAEHRQIVENAKDLGTALATSNGQLTAQSQSAAAAALENQKLAGTGRSLTEYLESVGVSGKTAARGLAGSRAEMEATLRILEKQALEEAKYQRDVSSKDLSWQGIKNAGKELFNYEGYRDKQNEAQNAFSDIKQLQEEAQRVAGEQRRIMQSAQLLDPSGTATQLGTLNDAMMAFAQSTGGAADKVGILASGLSTIRGDQMSAEDAQQRVNSSLRNFHTALTNGGAAAVDASGKINTATTAGDQLYSAMKGVQSAFDSAGAAAGQAAQQQGKSQEDIAAAARAAGQKVRDEFVSQAALIFGTRAEAEALADQYGLFPDKLSTDVQLMTSQATTDLNNFLNQPRTAYIDVQTRINIGTAQTAITNTIAAMSAAQGIPVAPRANGGIDNLPGQATIQPGRGGGLIQWAEGETGGEAFIPLSPSKRGRSTNILADVAQRFGYGLTKFAEGGYNGIQAALDAGRTNVKPYLWGGTGMDGWDCSGWVGWLQQIVMGASQAEAAGKRLYTTYSLLGGATAGLRPGLGPAGTQFQVGVSQEHMAATIAGIPAESGGAHGASRIGAPAVGATDPQFTNWFYLPNEMVSGGVNRRGVVSAYEAMKNTREWTDDDEDDLTEAHLRVRQEQESLNETQQKLNEGKASQVDLDRANLDLKRAQKKVLELQKQKDAAGAGQYIAPQAPELAKRYTDKDMERLDAQIAVDEANEKRNEAYDDPESTERDRLRADMELIRAEDALQEVLSGKKDGKDYSLRGVMKSFVDSAGDALIEGVFGQVPFGLGESRWVTTDWKSLVPDQTFSREEIESQLPVTPGVGDWVTTVLDAVDAQKGGPFDPEEIRKRLKVYDSGGWLEPGDMAINLSSRPEPIFNSPDQLRQFAGDLQTPDARYSRDEVLKMMEARPVVHFHTENIQEAFRKYRVEQKRQTLGFTRR